MRAAPTPTYISTKSDPEMEKKGTPASPARGTGQAGLAASRRPGQQHPLGRSRAHQCEPVGLAQVVGDLGQLLDRLVATGKVGEGDGGLLARPASGGPAEGAGPGLGEEVTMRIRSARIRIGRTVDTGPSTRLRGWTARWSAPGRCAARVLRAPRHGNPTSCSATRWRRRGHPGAQEVGTIVVVRTSEQRRFGRADGDAQATKPPWRDRRTPG